MSSKLLKSLKLNNPKLRIRSKEITVEELKLVKTQKIIDKLLEFVYSGSNKTKKNKASVVGLSANQVGILKRISIVDLAIGNKKFSDIHVLINPKIIWHSKEMCLEREGCVNLGNI